MNVHAIGCISLSSFPFPYKYLFAVGFYFYIKSHVGKFRFSTKEYLLFVPDIEIVKDANFKDLTKDKNIIEALKFIDSFKKKI